MLEPDQCEATFHDALSPARTRQRFLDAFRVGMQVWPVSGLPDQREVVGHEAIPGGNRLKIEAIKKCNSRITKNRLKFESIKASNRLTATDSLPAQSFGLTAVRHQVDEFAQEFEGLFSGGKVVLAAQIGGVAIGADVDDRPALRAAPDRADPEAAGREIPRRAGGDEDVLAPMGEITFLHEEME